MNPTLLAAKREFDGFRASDAGSFVIYAVLVLAWSVLLGTNMRGMAAETSGLWWVFLSVVVSGNFSANVFVSERLNGSLEILLTCGISRGALLAGKILYVIFMSLAMGVTCYALALVWASIGDLDLALLVRVLPLGRHFVLYAAACYMNVSCSAWLSLNLGNPRLSHFANLLVLALLLGIHAALTEALSLSDWFLPAAIAGAGVVFQALAVRAFHGEKVIQPAGP